MPSRTGWQLVASGALLWSAACSLDRGGLNPDASRPQGRDGGTDGGTDCRDCDDPYDCTVDTCVSGSCAHVPDDRECEMDEVCDPERGCVSAACNAFNCNPRDGCERAECIGDECSRSPACTAEQMCCNGSCAAIGCNDGNPCTSDTCATGGCQNIPMAGAVCDNGIFCDGPDSCDGDGNCIYSTDPCPGLSMCDESMDTCTGCVTDADCPLDIPGPWGACGEFEDTCDESGLEQRTITTFTCVAGGVCQLGFVPDARPCGRETDGTLCGTEVCDPYPSCVYTDDCVTTGPAVSRTCRTPLCSGALCMSSARTEMMPCMRTTDGLACPDGVFCNGVDRCMSGGCFHPGSPCMAPTPMCVEGAGGAGSCVECTAPSQCDDGNPCTNDTCNGSGVCVRTNNTLPCPDGMFCNGVDVCSGGSCTHPGNPCTTPPATMCDETADRCYQCTSSAMCNDGRPCTDDSCNPGTGLCVFTNDDTNTCTDGMFCTFDACSGGSCVAAAGDPCPGPSSSCVESSDICDCANDNDCRDGDSGRCTTGDVCLMTSPRRCMYTYTITCTPTSCGPGCTGGTVCRPFDNGTSCVCQCQ